MIECSSEARGSLLVVWLSFVPLKELCVVDYGATAKRAKKAELKPILRNWKKV